MKTQILTAAIIAGLVFAPLPALANDETDDLTFVAETPTSTVEVTIPAPAAPAEPADEQPTPAETVAETPEPTATAQPVELEAVETNTQIETDVTSQPVALESTETAMANGYVLPLKSKSYWLSSYFGARCPVAVGAGVFHGAIDLAADRGTPLYAMTDGTIQSVDAASGTLTISSGSDGGQSLIISYGHIDNPTKYVNVGDKVKKGQKVAEVGDTGVSNGPHVHLAVKHGSTWVDPLSFFSKRGIDFAGHATRVAANTNATTCKVYTTARTVLKASPANDAKSIRILSKDEALTLTPKDENGFWKVKTSDGTTGYIHGYRASTLKGQSTQPGVSYGAAAKTTYRVDGSRHLFDYPGTTEPSRGILETIQAGEQITTTGRTANGYTEVTWKNLTGWVKLEYVTQVQSAGDSVLVQRFWSKKFNNAHFYTANSAEAEKIKKSDKNWVYEGGDFRVWTAKNGTCTAGKQPVYRFWSTKFESHFYTTSAAERNKVRDADKNWSYEGVAFCTSTTGGADMTPVHRFWSPKFQKHFYTANQSEANRLRTSDKNWNYEGVAMYSPKA